MNKYFREIYEEKKNKYIENINKARMLIELEGENAKWNHLMTAKTALEWFTEDLKNLPDFDRWIDKLLISDEAIMCAVKKYGCEDNRSVILTRIMYKLDCTYGDAKYHYSEYCKFITDSIKRLEEIIKEYGDVVLDEEIKKYLDDSHTFYDDEDKTLKDVLERECLHPGYFDNLIKILKHKTTRGN